MVKASLRLMLTFLSMFSLLSVGMLVFGQMRQGDILGYVSSNKIYLLDVEHRIPLDTHVTHAAAGSGRWSPDLRHLAFVDTRRNILMLIDIDSGELHTLTDNAGQNFNPIWSPDGSKLAYLSDADGNFAIYVLEMSSGAVNQITNNTISN